MYREGGGGGLAGGGGGIGWGIKGGCVCSKGLIRESSMWRRGSRSRGESRGERGVL